VFYLDIPDREVFYHPFSQDVMAEIFEKVKPATVFLPAFQEFHPDHRAVTQNFLSFLDITATDIAATTLELWFYEINRHGEINRLIDIASVLDQKEEAIECYESQLSQIDYKVHALCMNMTRSITLDGNSCYAEGFWAYHYGEKRTPAIDYFNSMDLYRTPVNQRCWEQEEFICQLKNLKSSFDSQKLQTREIMAHALKMADYLNEIVDKNEIVHGSRMVEVGGESIEPETVNGLISPRFMKLWFGKTAKSLIARAAGFIPAMFGAGASGAEKIENESLKNQEPGATLFPLLDLENYLIYSLVHAESASGEHWGACWCSNSDRVIPQHKADKPVPFFPGQTICFRIKSRARFMGCIEIFMATYERINPGTLILKLYDDPDRQNCLRSSMVQAATVYDNSFVAFYFNPVENSEKKDFFVSLELEGGIHDLCLGLWTSSEFPPLKEETYQFWLKNNEQIHMPTIEMMDQKIVGLSWRPKILVVVCLKGLAIADAAKTFLSVKEQGYPEWRLAVVCEKEECEAIEAIGDLPDREFINNHKKVSIFPDLDNAVNSSNGDFVLFLDPGDTLPAHALYEAAVVLDQFPNTDLIYADEDKLTEEGMRTDPFFKPDWSPDLIMTCMYMGGFSLYKKSMLLKAGALKGECESWLEYDLTLRITELTHSIYHIPKILYHRGQVQKRSVHVTSSHSFDRRSAIKVIAEALKRRGLSGEIMDGLTPQSFRVKKSIDISKFKVSIIIPFRDGLEVLQNCVQSILDRTCYNNYEIILVDNQSVRKETFLFLEKVKAHKKIRVLNYDFPFNYAAVNNYAVDRTEGEILFFLNSDTEVISGEWIDAMLEHAMEKKIGAVGAKLYYPNDTIQHAGVVLGIAGLAGHAFKHISRYALEYYYGFPNMVRNVSAVTGACMMMRKSVYEEVGGFDQVCFKVAYNDIDLCMKLRQKGYGIIYTPFAELYHYESYSRGSGDGKPLESNQLFEKWGDLLNRDPFYNQNLTTTGEAWKIDIEG